MRCASSHETGYVGAGGRSSVSWQPVASHRWLIGETKARGSRGGCSADQRDRPATRSGSGSGRCASAACPFSRHCVSSADGWLISQRGTWPRTTTRRDAGRAQQRGRARERLRRELFPAAAVVRASSSRRARPRRAGDSVISRKRVVVDRPAVRALRHREADHRRARARASLDQREAPAPVAQGGEASVERIGVRVAHDPDTRRARRRGRHAVGAEGGDAFVGRQQAVMRRLSRRARPRPRRT